MKTSSIHRRNSRPLFVATISIAVILVGPFGCQAPSQPNGPTQMTMRVADKEALIDDTLTLLRELDFPPDRVDRERGTITAGPSTGGQWFEIWRRDVHGGYQMLESSLHTIRREVGIKIEPLSSESESDEYRLSVEVKKFRYSAPDRQITTASGALAIYSEQLPTTEGLRNALSAAHEWVPLGRDGLLEQALLTRIAELSQIGGGEKVTEEPVEPEEAG